MGRTRKVIQEIQLIDDEEEIKPEKSEIPINDDEVNENTENNFELPPSIIPLPVQTEQLAAESLKVKRVTKPKAKKVTFIKPIVSAKKQISEAEIRRKIEAEYKAKHLMESKIRADVERQYAEKFINLENMTNKFKTKNVNRKEVKFQNNYKNVNQELDEEDINLTVDESESDYSQDEQDLASEIDYPEPTSKFKQQVYQNMAPTRARSSNSMYEMIFKR
jgi:hypothetical protein